MGNELSDGSDPSVEIPPWGTLALQNFENTCYLNASLQCLAHTPAFAAGLLALHERSKAAPPPPDGSATPQTVAQATAALVWQSWRQARGPNSRGWVAPSALKAAVDAWSQAAPDRARFLGVSEQHDAFEFLLTVLLEGIHTEVALRADTALTGTGDSLTVTEAHLRAAQRGNDAPWLSLCALAEKSSTQGDAAIIKLRLETSVLANRVDAAQALVLLTASAGARRLLARVADNALQLRVRRSGESMFTQHCFGQWSKLMTCAEPACGAATLAFPTFRYIDCPLLPSDPSPLPLWSLLERCSEPRDVDGWVCHACGRRAVKRTLTLWRCPDVLIVRVARVCKPPLAVSALASPSERERAILQQELDSRKLSHKVAYPTRLDVAPLLHPAVERTAGQPVLLELTSALLHHGSSPIFGHYVAHCRVDSAGPLFLFDDKVRSCCVRAPHY
jgi:ubiquitin C-terminal hydrolase